MPPVVLKTPSEVIAALGGTSEAARTVKRSPQSVCNWRTRDRIDPGLVFSICDALRAINPDLTVDRALFRRGARKPV